MFAKTKKSPANPIFTLATMGRAHLGVFNEKAHVFSLKTNIFNFSYVYKYVYKYVHKSNCLFFNHCKLEK